MRDQKLCVVSVEEILQLCFVMINMLVLVTFSSCGSEFFFDTCTIFLLAKFFSSLEKVTLISSYQLAGESCKRGSSRLQGSFWFSYSIKGSLSF